MWLKQTLDVHPSALILWQLVGLVCWLFLATRDEFCRPQRRITLCGGANSKVMLSRCRTLHFSGMTYITFYLFLWQYRFGCCGSPSDLIKGVTFSLIQEKLVCLFFGLMSLERGGKCLHACLRMFYLSILLLKLNHSQTYWEVNSPMRPEPPSGSHPSWVCLVDLHHLNLLFSLQQSSSSSLRSCWTAKFYTLSRKNKKRLCDVKWLTTLIRRLMFSKISISESLSCRVWPICDL